MSDEGKQSIPFESIPNSLLDQAAPSSEINRRVVSVLPLPDLEQVHQDSALRSPHNSNRSRLILPPLKQHTPERAIAPVVTTEKKQEQEMTNTSNEIVQGETSSIILPGAVIDPSLTPPEDQKQVDFIGKNPNETDKLNDDETQKAKADSLTERDSSGTDHPLAIKNANLAFETPRKSIAQQKRQRREQVLRRLDLAGKIFLAFFWFVMICLFVWYMITVFIQLINSYHSPTTSVSYLSVEVQNMPRVTICNWNQAVNTTDCPYCMLSLDACLRTFDGANCTDEFVQTNKTTKAGTFFCYEWNTDPNNIVQSDTTGYAGGYAVVLSSSAPPTDPTLRGGIQISFTAVNEEPELFDEVNFVPNGFDGFYTLQAHQKDFINGTSAFGWGTKSSLTRLKLDPQPGKITFGASFSFQDLSVQNIQEVTSYTIANFFGDFSGFAGMLLGLDSIKIAAAFLAGILSIYLRSIEPLADALR